MIDVADAGDECGIVRHRGYLLSPRRVVPRPSFLMRLVSFRPRGSQGGWG